MIVDWTDLPRLSAFDLYVAVDHHADIPYAIRDGGNHDEVIVRSHSLENLLAWAEAFCAKEGANLDADSVEIALGAAALKTAIREALEEHSVKVPDRPKLHLLKGA